MRSLFEPCGSWQVAQLSATGACSHMYGPRFSAWQLVQLSSIVVPVFSSFWFELPWTLWHDAHDILPSRTGMWLKRFCLFTIARWHDAHSSDSLFAFSCLSPTGECTLWQLAQPTLRLSCWLPAHRAWVLRSWQLVQSSLAS